MADLEVSVVGQTVRLVIEIGSLEAQSHPSVHCGELWNMFCSLPRFSGNAVHREGSSSSILKESQVIRRRAEDCNLPAGLVRPYWV